MPFPKDHKYTAEEFFELSPESSSEQYELINGEIVALASPSELHQRILGEIFAELRNYIKSNMGSCRPFVAPFDVKLNDSNVVQPDVMVICDRDKLDGKRCNGAPDLVIEVASSNYARDYIDKLDLYSKAGVREYWIVDPAYNKILVYFFEKNRFPNIYTFDAAVPVGIYDGKLNICIAELLA
ncbi:MAG: Uma2 family endonuclease [Ruminococcus sp.]|nr:Uma2 family endonuclease [Ruminococcus sp.]